MMTPMPEPLSLLLSLPQRRLFVLQGGQVLAAAVLPVRAQADAAALQGHSLFHWHSQGRWQAHGADEGSAPGPGADQLLWRQLLPADPAFAQRLRAALLPGSSLLVSALPAVGDVHVAVWKL